MKTFATKYEALFVFCSFLCKSFECVGGIYIKMEKLTNTFTEISKIQIKLPI
jgi:hypothetical protein